MLVPGGSGGWRSAFWVQGSGFWVQGLLGGSGDFVSRHFIEFSVISIITPIRIPIKVRISLLITHLLSPPPSK